MKKLTRKLFISIMTLVLTVMALGTSTFAWFSMNTTATATGMSVTAKSNATYLLIGDDQTNAAASTKTNAAGGALTDNIAAVKVAGGLVEEQEGQQVTTNKCYPAFLGDGTTKLGKTTVNDQEVDFVSVSGTWYSASSSDSDNATVNTVNVKTIDANTAATFNKYVLTYNVWLTLSADSEDYNDVLTVSLLKVANSDASIACAVKIGSETLNLNPTDADFAAASTGDVIATADTTANVQITASTAVLVTIYVYIDGTSANVKSTTTSAINGLASIKFDLNVD